MASILVNDAEVEQNKPLQSDRAGALVTWIMSRVKPWREQRQMNYDARDEEYFRLWRGMWDPKDKSRLGERSRIITPALQQAIEMTVAEMVEATFGGGTWFDVSDDVEDQEKEDMLMSRDKLLEDFKWAGVEDEISMAYLIGCITGNGVLKIKIDEIAVPEFSTNELGEMTATETLRPQISVEAIMPFELVTDPAAKTLDDGLGVTHEVVKPIHQIRAMQRKGEFRDDVMVSPMSPSMEILPHGVSPETGKDWSTSVLISEWHGKVPTVLLDLDNKAPYELDEDELTEAIVTIANEGLLLKAVHNPYVLKDRSFVGYQHEHVPGKYKGRGVAEKGYNPQKALDAETRARIDAMALTINPAFRANLLSLPPDLDMTLYPGKVFYTSGPISESLDRLDLGSLDPATFNATGDFERMVQVATGAMDSATPMHMNERNSTATGTSMQAGGVIKRSKRTMHNVSRNMLDPLIRKSLRRYMQFMPERYPGDAKFVVHSTMGIMAREFEQIQLTNLLQSIDQKSPAHSVILEAIFENSSATNKAELIAALNEPPSEQEQQMEQLRMKGAQLEVAQLEADVQETGADTQVAMSKVALAQADMALKRGQLLKIVADLQEKEEAQDFTMFNSALEALEKEYTRGSLMLQSRDLDIQQANLELNQKRESNKQKGKSK